MARELFQLEWLGGAAEHHYRKAKPDVTSLPWGTLEPGKYPTRLLDAARRAWTEVAVNEYRATVAFTHVLGAMALAKAPLDLLGMASAFVTDEVSHVELASRVAMELGGAVPQPIEMTNFGAFPASAEGLTPLQRATELVLRVSFIAEAFSGATSVGSMRVASHPLLRAVHEQILADESLHMRLGPLYFEWVADQIDDQERARLSDVARDTLRSLSPFWHHRVSKVTDGLTEEGYRVDDIHELGWLESARFVPLAREVVDTHILAPLATFGIVLRDEDRLALFDLPPRAT
jgi:hypothetical protein